jgi:hypothetical protein
MNPFDRSWLSAGCVDVRRVSFHDSLTLSLSCHGKFDLALGCVVFGLHRMLAASKFALPE